MDPGAEQYRVAMTAFDDAQSLWTTVHTLLSKGFVLEQICLVALAATMARIGPPDGATEVESSRLTALTEQLEDWPTTGNGDKGDGHRIVATAGPLFKSMLAAQSVRDGVAFTSHVSPEHRADLEAKVQQGATILVVKALNPAQQLLSTRTLLDQSSHSVKTYDFAVQPGTGPVQS